MKRIKRRNWSKKEDEDLVQIVTQMSENSAKITWNDIASLMREKNSQYKKSGKQCRERWTNQLNPNLKRTEIWDEAENHTLFTLHSQIGNKWSEISEQLPGRTDNCVKNHFYSTLRRGMRKINSYIQNVKRKKILVKIFKSDVLNKILALCQEKFDGKFQFTDKAKNIATRIKEKLITVSLNCSENDNDDVELKDEIHEMICEFTRNCRKRKSKKLKKQESDSEVAIRSENRQGLSPRQKTGAASCLESKPMRKNQSEKQIEEICGSLSLKHFEPLFRKQQVLAGGHNDDIEIEAQIFHGFSTKVMDEIVVLNNPKEEKPLDLCESYGSSKLMNSNLIKSRNSLFGPGMNIETSQDWFKNQNYGELKRCGFIDSVPEVNKQTGSISLFGCDIDNKKGQFNFAAFGAECLSVDLQSIFRLKTINLSENLKSEQFEKSFNFSVSQNDGGGMMLQFNTDCAKNAGQIYLNYNPFPELEGQLNSKGDKSKSKQAEIEGVEKKESEDLC